MSYEPTHAALDKLWLFTPDFNFKPELITCQPAKIVAGEVHGMDTYYYNSELFNLDIKHVNGTPHLKVAYNPANVLHGQVMKSLNDIGIRFNDETARIARFDVQRTATMKHDISAYRHAFFSATYSRFNQVAYQTTYNVRNKQVECELYDKSRESNLKEPNRCRLEVRYKKASLCSKLGITTFADLKEANLHQLYIAGIDKTLPYLHNLEAERVNQIATLQNQLNQLHHSGTYGALTTLLKQHGFNSIGADELMQIIQGADIDKKKRYRMKQEVRKLEAKFVLPPKADVISDLLKFVA
ncbi:MAG: hypothetical protein ACK5Q2_15220 [Bacteroidota bacterium]|jgi:hypothetical protein